MDGYFLATGVPALDADDLVSDNSITAGLRAASTAYPWVSYTSPSDVFGDDGTRKPWDGKVNYAPGSEDPSAVTLGKPPSDRFVIDLDPTGEKTAKFLKDNGMPGGTQSVLSAQLVGGLVKSREWLEKRPEGQRLLAIIGRDRAGRKRDLWESLTDVGPSDLPFMSLVGTQAGSIANAVRVADTFRKMQNGEEVTDDEALSATLFLAETRRREDGTFGATVGDIVRAAPGFMMEFLATGSLGQILRTGAAKAAGEGSIHLAMTRASKVVSRELIAAEAGKAGADLAKETVKRGILKRTARAIVENTMRPDNPLYRGLSPETLEAMAEKRAAYDLGQYVSRTARGRVANGFNSFLQWGQNHVSRGLIDFGAWGTEESTIAYTSHTTAGRALADAVGSFLVEAPIKGVAMWAPNQYGVRPLIEKATGNDRSVSQAQLGLMQTALFTGNREMMDDAESISLGQNLLEYVSENAGRGFGALLRGAGLAVDKVAGAAAGKAGIGYIPLVTPASRVIRAEGAPLVSEEAGVSVGGKIREWVQKLLGTREDFNRKVLADKSAAVIAKLGVTSEADKAAVRVAVLNNSTAGLRRDLADRVGGDISAFTRDAVRSLYDDTVARKSYQSFARFCVADFMARHGINPTGLMNLYSRMGYDGILGEMFEERYSDVAKGLFNLDERQDGEKWWNLDFKEAVKGLYPGFDQLAAEAIGFAVPMVTRGVAMRMASKVGGEGVVNETQNMLRSFRDVTRTDEIFEISKGDYIRAMDRVMEVSSEEIRRTNEEIARAEAANADPEKVAGMRENLRRLETVDARRRERHQKWLSVDDIAKANADDLVAVSIVSDQQLAGDDAARIPVYSSLDVKQSATGRNAMVGYAPTLARNLFEFQSSFEGESQPWYRWFAQKAIGFTAGLVTGDFSAMRGNAVEWHARDVGLDREICRDLKAGYAKEYRRQAKRLTDEGKALAVEHGVAGTYAVPKKDILAATDTAFAQQARNIMSGYLEASQFRTFTQGRFRDQAILKVARDGGYEVVTRDAQGNEQSPTFYKVNPDGTFDDSSAVTADEIEEQARTRDSSGKVIRDLVKETADDITAATVNALTRYVTRGEYKRSAHMRLARIPRNFDGLSMAIVDSALELCGRRDLVETVEVDGETPMKDAVVGSSVAKVNMDVVSYIASKDKVDDVDHRALESVAQSMGMRFDGSEQGLADRNARVFRLAKLANAVQNRNEVWFSGSTPTLEGWDSRVNSSNSFPLKAERRPDGTYVVVRGFDPNSSERITERNSDTYASYDELVAAMRGRGFDPVTPRVVFTRARAIEFTDMYTALRDLDLVPDYMRLCEAVGAKPHPMLRRHAGTNQPVYTEREAADMLAELEDLASRWDPDTSEARDVPSGKDAKDVKDAWRELWDPKTGFLAIGERLLRAHGVYTDNPIAKYAGEFHPYVQRRYTMAMGATRIDRNRPDIYVPISADTGFDYTTSIINAHLLDAYQKNPALLKDALGGIISDFVNDVYYATEAYLSDPEVKKDADLSDQLSNFQRAYLKACDRVVRDPRTGSDRVIRGRELTPASFAVLASQFALFRAGKYDQTGDYSRAVALIAPLVQRQGSFIPFMNTVDLVLGGNGFLSEMVSNANGKEEELGTQAGIRGLLAAASGDANAFRNEFKNSALGRGIEYKDFLRELVRSMERLPQSGVMSRQNKEGAAASEAVRKVRASITQEALDKALSDAAKESERKLAAKQAEVDALRSETTKAKKEVEELRGMLASAEVKMKAASSDLQRLGDELSKANKSAVDVSADIETMLADATRLVGEGVADATLPGRIEAARKAYASALDDVNKLRRELRAAQDAGIARQSFEPNVTRSASEDGAGSSSSTEPFNTDPYAWGPDPDVSFSVVGDDAFVEELPDVFSEAADGEPLDIRWGNENKLGYELTVRQARLAVNQVIRGITAIPDGVVTEDAVVAMAREIFRGFSDADLDLVRTQFREVQDRFARSGRDLSEIEQVSTGDLWSEDDKDDESVSSDNFNEKSVAEFESKELGDFLALASKASPETGRNFQALMTSVRELNRWQLSFVNDHAEDYGVRSQDVRDAVKFLNDFLNPRGNAAGKTMSDRLALFERQLRLFDDDPALVRKHLGTLLTGGRGGRPLTRKGAVLLSYLLSLKPNNRNRFAVLVSNSLCTSAIHLEAGEGGRMVPRVRTSYKMSEAVCTDSFSDLVGKSKPELKAIAARIRAAFRAELAKPKKAGGEVKPGDISRLLDYDGGDDSSVVQVIGRNGMEIALKLSEVFGAESPLFTALTSPRLVRYMASVLSDSYSGDVAKRGIRTLAQSMAYRRYVGNDDVMSARTGIELVDAICSTLDLMAETEGETVTRADVASWFTATFATGDPKLGMITMAPNTSRVTSPLMTLMSMYDSSLPETVVRADFDPERSRKSSSVAVASRGLIPLGNRFMDREFERLCAGTTEHPVFSREEVERLNPGKTFEEVMAECRSDLTWPDEFRTPIFAKSLSRDLTAREVLDACERTFKDQKAATWYVPVYAGDHSSAVLIQLPRRLAKRIREAENSDSVVKDVFGDEIPSTVYTRKADRVCEFLGLDLLGTDAKRSALSSLECEGASMRGVKGFDAEGNPQFGECRMCIGYVLDDSFTNEEMKGATLLHGYGARQLRSMAKDPDAMLVKCHLIGVGDDNPAFIKSLSSTVSARERYVKGTAMRALQDWAESEVADEWSSVIYTDGDSYKIGVATNGEVLESSTLLDVVIRKVKETYRDYKTRTFDIGESEVDALVGPVKTADGTERKVSELLPGLRLKTVTGTGAPVLGVSFRQDSVIGYAVANVSHESKVPAEAGRTPRNQEVDAMMFAASLMRLEDAGIASDVAQRAIDLISNWGVVAAATVSDPSFMRAMTRRSSTIAEMLRAGEDPNGQNVKAELVRVVNAQLRRQLNIPVNALDAALVSGCASRGKDGTIHDLTKSSEYQAMNRGSKWFAKDEVKFWGVKRQLPLWPCNVRDVGFRNAWLLDEKALETFDDWLHGKVGENEETHEDFYAGTEEFSGDERIVVMFENLFSRLRREEANGRTRLGMQIREYVARLFQDQYGKTLLDRRNSEGDAKFGQTCAAYVSFDDLFHDPTGRGEWTFDRSAFRINSDYGSDRIRFDGDGENYRSGRIVLGGSLIGVPRTPSYNALLITGRAGLYATEQEPEKGKPGDTVQGYSAAVMVDPQTKDTEGVDFDGDKTKLYFLRAEDGRVVEDDGLPALTAAECDRVRRDDGDARYQLRTRLSGLLSRKRMTEDGVEKEIDPLDEREYDYEFRDISEAARRHVANAFARAQFSMALALPSTDGDGNERALPDRRVDAIGSAAFHEVGPTSAVGKDGMAEIKAAPGVPEGILEKRDASGRKVNKIGKVRVATVVTDGASEAKDARANVVSIMKDIQLMWLTGMFFSAENRESVFGEGAEDPVGFWAHVGRDDGISNSTFDDMKEQICARLGWRPGVMDALFTDILANADKDTGIRGRMPTTRVEFLTILKRFSYLVNHAGSSRWWMDRVTTKSNAVEYGQAVKKFGKGDGDFRRISRASVMEALGIVPDGTGRPDGFKLGEKPSAIAKAVHEGVMDEAGKNRVRGELKWLVDAGSGRGRNATMGYLMYLSNLKDLSDKELRKFVRFMRVYSSFQEGRRVVGSFNFMNVDIGNDTESGRRDRAEETFGKFVYEKDANGNLTGVVKPEVAKATTFPSGYSVLLPMIRMRTAMATAYDVGRDLMTHATRATLASERYFANAEHAARYGREQDARVIAGTMAMDRLDSGAFNRLKLETNAQQVPYVLAGFKVFSKGVAGSPIAGADKMYRALEGIASGLAGKDRDSYVLAMRHGIEAMFDVMYRLATTSDEHRTANNVFSYFREAEDGAFTDDYGGFGEGLYRIQPSFRANTEESVEAVRAKVERVIQGKSFAGPRSNRAAEEPYRFAESGTFGLSAKRMRAAAKKYAREDVAEEFKVVASAIEGMEEALGLERDTLEITPAMMFGQLLPMYSVLTSRTVGAPTPTSASILNLLPTRMYRELSERQVENDIRNRAAVEMLLPLQWGPRKLSRGKSLRSRGEAVVLWRKNLVDAADRLRERARAHEGDKEPVMRRDLEEIMRGVRGEADGEQKRDWRVNPEYRSTFDPFAADGLVLRAIEAIDAARSTDRETPEPGPAEVLRGEADSASTAAKPLPPTPAAARYARALGALCGSWASVKCLGGNVIELHGNLRGNLATFTNDGKTVLNHKAVITVTVGDGDFVDDERTVEALAGSHNYASSFCAATDFADAEGRPLTAERFMALPLEVRKALVRKYGVGAATCNKAAWTLDGKGVATLCGAIRLRDGRNGTKLYHEYFHAMMRFWDALGMLTDADHAELAAKFNRDGSDVWTLGTEEIMAEEFRKWVVKNTEPKDAGVLTVFRRIFEFLKGLLNALARGFSYGVESEDFLFKMAVHGFASASENVKEQAVREAGGSYVDADAVKVAEAIGQYRGSRLWRGAERRADDAFTREQVVDLLPGEPTDAEVDKIMSDLALGRTANRRKKTVGRLMSLWAKKYGPQFPVEDLDKSIAETPTHNARGAAESVQDAIDGNISSSEDMFREADDAEARALNVIPSPDATADDVRAALAPLVSARCRLAEDGGYQFSEDTASPRLNREPTFEVVAGSDEANEAEVHAAVGAGTVNRDRYGEKAMANLDSRVGDMIMENLMSGLERDGRMDGTFAEVMRAFGDPTAAEAADTRDKAVRAVRDALLAVNPNAEVSREKIEGSMAYEAVLRLYQRIESSQRHKVPRNLGPGAQLSKQYATHCDVAAWILAKGHVMPNELLESAIRRIGELGRGYTEGTAGYGEFSHLADSFREIRRLFADPTGLMAYRRGQAAEYLDLAIQRIRTGLIPKDADPTDRSTWEYFDEQGFQKDLKPVVPSDTDDPDTRKEASDAVTHRYLLQGCLEDKPVQEALKLAVRTTYELEAMVKYMDEFKDVPPTVEDIAFANYRAKYDAAKPVGDADWLASQAISTSNLLDNRNLVEHVNQSYFIAANVDQWLSSMIRPVRMYRGADGGLRVEKRRGRAFGAKDLRDVMLDENREFGAIKTEILNLENFYSRLYGDDVEANGRILKLMEQDREFDMEFGAVTHGMFGKALKFDGFRDVRDKTVMTQRNLQDVDLFKKAAKADVQRQDSLVTGVNRVIFDSSMPDDPAAYAKETILALERETGRNGRQLTTFEEALWRMTEQIPEHILFGKTDLYGRFVKAACDAIRDAKAVSKSGDARPAGFDFNTHVLRALEAAGLVVAQEAGGKAHEDHPRLRQGAVTIPVRDFLDYWEHSDTLDKLVKARWIESDGYVRDGEKDYANAKSRLSLDAYERDMMAVWRKAARFARQHAWLTDGDGRFLNMFGTCLPFFSGSGVFMYGANRRDRAQKRRYSRNLSKYEAGFREACQGRKATERVAENGDVALLMSFLHDMYGTRENGDELRDAIAAGRYERGPNNVSGLVLSKDCTRADVADAIYTALLERADREEAGLDVKGGREFNSADELLKAYEDARGAASDMFGGSTGLNDVQMFRLHGVLPANDQLGHAVHKSIDGITTAIMQRNVLANMILTPNADGSPVYYAEPDELAVQQSGLPDEFWETVARWWADWNGAVYDEKKSGVENARAVYAAVHASVRDHKGLHVLSAPGMGDHRPHRYRELPNSESDLVSIKSWLAVDDEESGDDTSYLDLMSGGEAMGYLRQFCQAGRVLGFGGAKTRATLHRALSWSKSMSVSFSFFFPIATKWESPVGAVGAMATVGSNGVGVGGARIDMAKRLRDNPALFNALQKTFGGRGWITKDFLGFTDIVRMMDSNDPFLAELISWAEALGVKISDRFVNPVEPTRGLVDSDLRVLKGMVKSIAGAERAATFGRITKAMFSRQSEKSFSYALNATKLAVVAQMCMKLRAEAVKRGKAFDPVRDLRRYSSYINAEVGGIDPLKYAWATPRFRGFMNCLLFSWEWTRGAWEAGGGAVLEDVFLGGHATTLEERAFYLARWSRMFGEVMIGVPAMIQMLAWALAKVATYAPDDWFGKDDDDREKLRDYVGKTSPFTWDNEGKTRWTAADLTPLLKVIGSANVGWLPGVDEGTTLADAKERHPFALGWLPAYTGTDSANWKTKNRRLYLHFGKQGWEEFRWFDQPVQQFFSKLSMPAQRLLEGMFGRNLGYLDRGLPWEDKGIVERFLDPSFDGALWNVASAFLPFSVSGLVRTGDAGFIPIVGPVQYGASYTALNDRLVDRFTAFAENDRRFYLRGYAHKGKFAKWSANMIQDIAADAVKNGVPAKTLDTMVTEAASQVRGRLYGRLWRLIPDDPAKDFDAEAINRTARALFRLGAGYESALDSLKKTLGGQGLDWSKVLTPAQRHAYITVLRGLREDPFYEEGTRATVEHAAETESFDY